MGRSQNQQADDDHCSTGASPAGADVCYHGACLREAVQNQQTVTERPLPRSLPPWGDNHNQQTVSEHPLPRSLPPWGGLKTSRLMMIIARRGQAPPWLEDGGLRAGCEQELDGGKPRRGRRFCLREAVSQPADGQRIPATTELASVGRFQNQQADDDHCSTGTSPAVAGGWGTSSWL